jgi:hypothetical protein
MVGWWWTEDFRSGETLEQKRTIQGLVLALLLPALVMLNGCTGLIAANGSTGAGALQLSPTSVSFGKITVGKQSTQSVTVANTGTTTLNVTGVQVSNPQFAVTGLATPLSLGARQSTKFSVAITPSAAGNITGTLSVMADASTSPFSVNLSASAVANSNLQLSVNPTSIDFGAVSTGQKASSNLVLSNNGATDLTISMLTLTGANFTVSGITTPKTISAGQSATVTVTFAPVSTASVTGSVAIVSNDPTNPTFTVPLSGSGSSTAAGQLTAAPASVAFGTIAVGNSSKQSVVITNSGNAAVKISSVATTGAGYSVSGLSTPATLNPSASATLTATYTPSAVGNATGSITVVSDASNATLTIPLTGTGAQAGLSISPSTFNFGSVVDGQTKSQTFTVTNTGTTWLTMAQIVTTGRGYSVSGLSTPATIAAGASATFSVLFAPTTAGTFAGSVTITSNAPNSLNGVSLTGTGVAASVTLTTNPTSVSFTNINAGSSGSKNVTITNSGNSSVTVSTISVSAKDFSVSGIATPITLNAGQNAVMSVNFKPTASESITGNVTVSSSTGASAVIPVSGVGIQPGLTVTPSSASFGSVSVGSPSSQTIRLTNSGTGTLTVTQVGLSGSGFSTSTLSLPISLAASQSTTFNVVFSPASTGTANGALSIVSNAPNSPATIPLSGSGVAASETLSFSSNSLSFGNVNAGSSSTQTVTVTNTGNASITISSITEAGSAFTLSGAGAPVTLTVGQSLTFSVVYAPTAAGSHSGTVTVASNATGSPATISLSGTGVAASTHAVALNWTASPSSNVAGYNVYRSTTNGSGYAKINTALVSGVSYTDSSTLQSGTTYYYVTTAVDSSSNESSYSNQASATMP